MTAHGPPVLTMLCSVNGAKNFDAEPKSYPRSLQDTIEDIRELLKK
jgi:hypothetical protein